MVTSTSQALTTRLEGERARLQHLRSEVAEELPPHQRLGDQAGETSMTGGDLAAATAEREMERGLISSLDTELAEVEAALERVAAGTYGTCEDCGGPIGDERLEAEPAARFCIIDQARRSG